MDALPSLLLAGLLALANPVLAACADGTAADCPEAVIVAPVGDAEPDSARMEKGLQQLPWKKFRSVVEAIPKLRSEIEAYGPAGWQFVQANYSAYGWKKNIDRLDPEQKRRLAELIESAKTAP